MRNVLLELQVTGMYNFRILLENTRSYDGFSETVIASRFGLSIRHHCPNSFGRPLREALAHFRH
jgi:hypothetical protein